MCVKEFLGYNCGHCSIPFLRQCPLSSSNPVFPTCQYPAERPIFTNDYCHPCSRVVWNIKVLREEEEHKGRHLNGICGCEVIFEGEEREKQLRPRAGKGKGRGKEVIQEVLSGRGEFEGGESGSPRVRHNVEERGRVEINMVGEAGSSCPRQQWERQAQIAAYEYVGYYFGPTQAETADPPQPCTTPFSGYDGQERCPMGQVGAVMKWYPLEDLPQPPPTNTYQTDFEGIPREPRARSEPAETHINQRTEEDNKSSVIPTQPMVVSSDMARPEPT